ncbi:hypothetical protein ABZ858_04540 [Streptomyces sp. NPDC047017]|uniref:hypothetical protein n=1 Tax=Streptomyces sp. NPDC047017 TaxID=3155024 RepID=UPI0033C5C0AE
MSDEKSSTDNIHATGTKPGTVSTNNIHATSEPLATPNPLKAEEETGGASTDNIHATDEKA